MFWGNPYSLNLFQNFLNVPTIHQKHCYTSSSKTFHINLSKPLIAMVTSQSDSFCFDCTQMQACLVHYDYFKS